MISWGEEMKKGPQEMGFLGEEIKICPKKMIFWWKEMKIFPQEMTFLGEEMKKCPYFFIS